MQLTVKDLYKLCKEEIDNGNGNKKIVISDDNEGNGFHGLFYGFTPMEDIWEDMVYDSQTKSAKDTIILG